MEIHDTQYTIHNTHPKRIGINASFLRKPRTGIGQVTTHFLRALMREEGANSIFAKRKFILYLEEDIDWELPENFEKRILKTWWRRDDLIRKTWWERYILPRRARCDGCDTLLSLYQCPTVARGGMRHVMVAHDIIPRLMPQYANNWRKKLYWRLSERGLRKADALVAVSKRTEKDIIQHLHISAEKIGVAYIDVDPIFLKPVSDTRSSRVMEKYHIEAGYIYFGGGLDVRKNAESVLRAYRHLVKNKEKYPSIVDTRIPDLVISGKIVKQLAPLITDVESLAKSLNISNHVTFLGEVSQEDLPVLYKNARVFVYPSQYEGFGMPILEAMRMGTPVITSRTTSLPEIAGDAALYVDPDSVDDIASVLARAMRHKTVTDEMVRRGKSRAKRFSWKEFSKKILEKV